jgi:hypothetical protein
MALAIHIHPVPNRKKGQIGDKEKEAMTLCANNNNKIV